MLPRFIKHQTLHYSRATPQRPLHSSTWVLIHLNRQQWVSHKIDKPRTIGLMSERKFFWRQDNDRSISLIFHSRATRWSEGRLGPVWRQKLHCLDMLRWDWILWNTRSYRQNFGPLSPCPLVNYQAPSIMIDLDKRNWTYNCDLTLRLSHIYRNRGAESHLDDELNCCVNTAKSR